MKKALTSLLLIFALICNTAFADNVDYISDVKSYGIEPFFNEDADLNSLVTRYYAIILVCESVGFSSQTYSKISNMAFYGPAFEDIVAGLDAVYFRFAKLKNITYGTDGKTFNAGDNTTFEEAVAFASRCMTPPDGIKFSEMNLDDTWEFAKQKEIIFDSEFDDRKKDYVSYRDFYLLLSRLLDKPVYIDANNQIDDVSNMTYAQLLDVVGYDEINSFKRAINEFVGSNE